MIDKHVGEILDKLSKAHFEVAIVGGATRDIIAKKEVRDWDLTTSAKPEEIQKLFKNSFYNNRFGTVGVAPSRQNCLGKNPRRRFSEAGFYNQFYCFKVFTSKESFHNTSEVAKWTPRRWE
jgi:tRNA nucleotidyltransferase/poly(A) polymerase